MSKSEGSRNYGIDLLRMVAMLMVVLLHVLGQGGILDASVGIKWKNETLWFLEISAYCAVNCYALISGYVNSKPKYSSLVLIWLQVAFYTVLITAGFAIFKPESVGAVQIIKSIFPVTSETYWFFSSYFCMSLFLPFLSSAVETLTKKQFGMSLAVMTVMFSVVSLMAGGDTMDLNTGYSAVWLSYLFLLGAYVRKYGLFKNITRTKALFGYILCTALSWAVTVFSDSLLVGTSLEVYCGVLVTYTSPTSLGAGFFLFMLFKQINIGSGLFKKVIGLFSATSFSVYLLHSHPLVWEYLLKGRFTSVINEPIPLLVLITLGIAAGIYLFCSIIDIPRHLLFSALKLKEKLSSLERRITGKTEG